MSTVNWTEEQFSAITERGRNLLVAAAAGAGKTAVLVERIIRKITDPKSPTDIDRLLVVTFTNAAATEMRQRVGDAISKELDKNPDDKSLQRQLTLLNKASITTIHSFCLNVIKNNFQDIDIDPNFRIADETEIVLMKLEILEELFESRYQESKEGKDFLELVECYSSGKDDKMLQELVLNIFDFIQSSPWPEKWLTDKAEAFNLTEETDFSKTPWGEIILDTLRIELKGMADMLNRAIRIIHYGEGLMPYMGTFQEDTENIKILSDKCSANGQAATATWKELYQAFDAVEFGRLARCGKDADKVRQELVKSIRDEVRTKIKKIKEDIFASSPEEMAEDMKTLYPLIKCLTQVVLEFGERYAAKKKEKSLLDFNDLEHFCLNILSTEDEGGSTLPSSVALELRERFDEILVDEYQDSNLVQEVLLEMVSRKESDKPNLFMVGDVKQSIYKFRQAKPELFMDKYNSYARETGFKNRLIQLYKNFRSREEVIDSVNFIFRQIMSVDIGELNYDEGESLNLGASYQELDDAKAAIGGPVELNIIDIGSSEAGEYEKEDDTDESSDSLEHSDEAPEEQPDAMHCEARLVANKIKELMLPDSEGRVFNVFDKYQKRYRPVEYKDIVILLRSTKNWAEVFVEELGAQGIPAYADIGTGYFKTVEVQTILSLLQIIDNPLQDIPLISVLRSPIGNFSPEELIDLRLCDREVSLYEALLKLASEGSSSVTCKARDFLRDLEKWRDKALYMSTDELVWFLYSDTGYYSFTAAMPGGVQRQANLRILFERARQFEQTSYKGLFNFINFINRLKSSQGDMGSAKILGENENVVRIMSIHKSKGLEFPVVIAAGMGKNFNLMDLNRRILLHQDLGFGPDFVDYRRRVYYPTMPKQALRYKIKLESLSEEMRVLYVAFTRAKEKLIITGSVRNLSKSAAGWASCLESKDEKLPEYEMLKARNYLGWIGPAVMRHKDCRLLRELAGVESVTGLMKDPSKWVVRVFNKNEILTEKQQAEKDKKNLVDKLEGIADIGLSEQQNYISKFGKDINERLGWRYRYLLCAKLPTKISVTELKRRFNTGISEEYSAQGISVPQLIRKPQFLDEAKGFTAAERGTILHFVMQHLDLNKVISKNQISEQLKGMVGNDLLTDEEARTVDLGVIKRFFDSDVGKRMTNSLNVLREVPFNIRLKSTEVYKNLPEEIYGDETILLQGVIDCYFDDGGEYILVDYKTDYAAPGKLERIKEKYRIQVDYYARALESITGRRVKEKYIYLFSVNELIEY
jgi:ATP-dependent helicase/nuclease subunit A